MSFELSLTGSPGFDPSVNKVLAMFVDLDLTKVNIINYDSCYPEHIKSTDWEAQVHIISLLDHTIQRILLSFDEEKLKNLSGKILTLLGKWGMDGSSGQQTTIQEWSQQSITVTDYSSDDNNDDDNDEPESENVVFDPSDAAVFMTTFVPLRIKADDEIIWYNEKPSLVFYCRLINCKFAKETKEAVRNNYNYYRTTLDKVQLYYLPFKDTSFNVKFGLKCTMVDGKVSYILKERRWLSG